jgi:hypothetical protein
MTEAFYLDILLASPKHCLRAVPPFNWEVSAASGRGWGGAWPATPVASLRELLTATGWGCYSVLPAAVSCSARAQTFGSTNRLLIFENWCSDRDDRRVVAWSLASESPVGTGR